MMLKQQQSALATVALIGLVVLGCYLSVARANQDSNSNEEVNEGLQRGGGVANIFNNDVLDKGVPRFVDPESRDCRYMKDKKRCETCCNETNRAYIWTRDVKLLKMRWHGCTCSRRVAKLE